MPTKDDFELARDQITAAKERCEVFYTPLEQRMSSDVLEGGELTDSVYESMKVHPC